MNTDDNGNNLVDMDDLSKFEDDFFNRKSETEEVEDELEEVDENDEEVDENEEDEPLAIDPLPEDEDEDEEEDEEPEPKPKPKRNRTQERIEKLVAEARVAERERDLLRQQLEELKASKEVKKEEEAPALRDNLPAEAPQPDALNDKGEPVYPLGEFDPQFIRDITKFTIEQELKAKQDQQEREVQAKRAAEVQEEIRTHWIEKLDEAEAEVPEIRENIRSLTDAFQGLEPAYGEYLATTIMASDYGPHIMNYLSQNIGEAQRIVASGPAAATLALGRLEAMFIKPSSQEEPRRNKKVSAASPPPEDMTRGAHGRFTVKPDTDDLDAFEREFYKKR